MIARACRCGGRIRDKVCDRCGPKRVDERRKSSTERGYGPRWRKAADGYKKKHPLCVCCEAQGIATGQRGRTGILVDHIIPQRMAPELFWDKTNWQTLCHACDQCYKKPIEMRCKTGTEVVTAWQSLLSQFGKGQGAGALY